MIESYLSLLLFLAGRKLPRFRLRFDWFAPEKLQEVGIHLGEKSRFHTAAWRIGLCVAAKRYCLVLHPKKQKLTRRFMWSCTPRANDLSFVPGLHAKVFNRRHLPSSPQDFLCALQRRV